MSKPKEFAHLIRNRFGSADNINHIRPAAENVPTAVAPDEIFPTNSTAAVAGGLAAGNSNSLPGHGSQVRLLDLNSL